MLPKVTYCVVGRFNAKVVNRLKKRGKGSKSFSEAYKIAKKRFGGGYCQYILKFCDGEFVGFFWLDWSSFYNPCVKEIFTCDIAGFANGYNRLDLVRKSEAKEAKELGGGK